MKNAIGRVTILILILLLGALHVEAAKNNLSSEQLLQGKIMLATLDEIDNAPALSPASTGKILNVALQLDPQEANGYVQIYKGHNALWKSVELRLPRDKDGSRFVLVLQPEAPIPMNEIMNHYGDVLALVSPNPTAGDQGMFGFTYNRKIGTIMFSFHNFEDQSVRIILFDRM